MPDVFRAWHLPIDVHEARPLVDTPAGTVLAPVLSPADVTATARALLAAGVALRERTTADVLAAIDHVARRFLDPGDVLRAEALHWLPEVTGYAPAMCQRILDRMAADWQEAPLRRLLRAELRDPRMLEQFVHHAPGQRVRAVPPRLALHVLSGNVPGVGVTSMIRSLLVRAPALCKSASGEPVLPVLFLRALAEFDPGIAAAVAVAYWTGGNTALEQPALEHADVVIHYGSGDAIADLRRRLPPHARLVEHGPRISFAAVAREEVARRRTANDAALAVAMFDQQGCVSPHIIYVEEGGALDPTAFAARLADRLDDLRHELPRGRITQEEAARIQQARASAEFRSIAGENVRLWAGDHLAWTVIFDPDPTFTAGCLNRTVWVKPVYDLDQVPGLVRPHAHLLQTAGLAVPGKRRTDLAPRLADAGITRMSTLAHMPWPGPLWHHDGQGPLRELLRFSDLETRI